jgi:hypothetical protein
MRGSAWPRPKPIIELVLDGICPEYGGSLDTGWECNYWDCNFDGEPLIVSAIEAPWVETAGRGAKHESAVPERQSPKPSPVNQGEVMPRHLKLIPLSSLRDRALLRVSTRGFNRG